MSHTGIRGFYLLTKAIKDQLLSDVNVNTVTTGDLYDIDLAKQSIFPLSHIIVNNVTTQEQTLTFNITVMAMDIVDESKNATTDIFVGNDNEQDVLNTQLAVLNKLVMVLRRGVIYNDQYQLDGDATLEPFYERFENRLAGWAATFDVFVRNDIDIC
jgi:acetolactate synthase regulatory subunit